MIDALRRAAEVGRFCSIRGFKTKVERKLLDALAKPRSVKRMTGHPLLIGADLLLYRGYLASKEQS